jgi:hypothetical protein
LGFWIWNLEDGKWEAFEAKIEQGGWEDGRKAIWDLGIENAEELR